MSRRSRFGVRGHATLRSRRPVGVWVATGITVVLVALCFLFLFLPLLGLLAGVTGGTAGIIPLPMGKIIAVAVLGGIIAVGFLVLAGTRRHSATAWISGIVAILVALAVTAFPLFAVATGSAERAGDVWPTLLHIWRQITGG